MRNAADNVIVLPWNDRQAVLDVFAARGNEIAAIITEPVLCNSGCLLPDEGFLAELRAAFEQVPDLFCATAQIFFPDGQRREETGKAVWKRENPTDFPVRCDDPVPGEDLTWVLYGSGGCSLFDTVKLFAMGAVSEVYDPAYVEDLDLGYRAWKRGWPSKPGNGRRESTKKML